MLDGYKRKLGSRERRLLRLAYENGYLDAKRQNNESITRAFGFWCWRMRVPMVWFERHSPRSRYGRVHLDMFSTPHMLTESGQKAIAGLTAVHAPESRAEISAHDVCWEHVPIHRLGQLAAAVYRAATRTSHYELNQIKLRSLDLRREKVADFAPRRPVSTAGDLPIAAVG
jgi:hypothetical protein